MKKIKFLLMVIFCCMASFKIYEPTSFAVLSNSNTGGNVIDVGAPGIKRIKIFIDMGTLSARMTSILDFTNWFEFVTDPSTAEYVLSGKKTAAKSAQPDSSAFNLELSLFDTKLQNTITKKVSVGLNLKSADLELKKFADAAVKSLTGISGPFLSQIVFIGKKTVKENGQVYIADFDGGNLQQITHNKAINMSPSWAADGSKITYTSFESGKAEIYVYNLLTQTKTKLTSSGMNNSGANWSPDGSTIAYSAGTDSGETHIFKMNKRGTGVKSFISESEIEVEPAFSPDGKYLAYTSAKFKKPMIFVRDLSNDTSTRLTYAGWYNASASWTPDSKTIAFASYDRDIDKWDIFKIKSDGSDLERLTLNQGDNEKPTWSPDGRFILFQSDRTSSGGRLGRRKLYVMAQDGAYQKALNIPIYEVKQAYWGPSTE